MAYPGYCFLSSQRRGAYFCVFFRSFSFLFSIKGQLVSRTRTFFALLSIILASTRLALNSVLSACIGTSQKALARWFSYSGWRSAGECHGGVAEITSTSFSSSKYKILSSALCLAGYLVCDKALHPERTCGTLSGALPHSRQTTSDPV